MYGGFTPAGGIFVNLTSMAMLGTLMPLGVLVASAFAMGVAVVVLWCGKWHPRKTSFLIYIHMYTSDLTPSQYRSQLEIPEQTSSNRGISLPPYQKKKERKEKNPRKWQFLTGSTGDGIRGGTLTRVWSRARNI